MNNILGDDFLAGIPDDLGEALEGPKKGIDAIPAAALQAMQGGHREPCPNCRGRGRFISWAGRDVGPCRKCKGSGYLVYKQTFQQRQYNKAQGAARKARSAAENIAAFEAQYPEIAAWWTGSTFPFAISMREAVGKYGSLTENQSAAVLRCIAKLNAMKEADAARVANAKVIDMAQIEAAFASAGAALKKPTLRVAGLVISPASATSRNAGSLYVKQDGLYLGKITEAKFIRSRDCSDEQEADLLKVAASPKDAAIAYGRMTGNCACCGKQLTNKASVELGIGPICAARFGWGG